MPTMVRSLVACCAKQAERRAANAAAAAAMVRLLRCRPTLPFSPAHAKMVAAVAMAMGKSIFLPPPSTVRLQFLTHSWPHLDFLPWPHPPPPPSPPPLPPEPAMTIAVTIAVAIAVVVAVRCCRCRRRRFFRCQF
jgi:hypothetical protein